jgi:hypothetical protein
MTRRVEILAVDWERLRRAYPERDDGDLSADAARRGAGIARRPPVDVTPPSASGSADGAGRLSWLRAWFPRRAASICAQRFDLVTGRDRFRRAAELEERTYREHLHLERELVPPLKEEAKALRAELRALERKVRELGVDPETIEPRIDWPRTLAVDTYTRPQYESNDARRQRAVDFFRRLR